MKTRPLLPALAVCFTTSLFSGTVIINEIHHSPADKTVPEEFVELYNTGATAVSLAGWYFSNGVSFTFPAGTTIDSGAYLVVARDPAVLAARFGSFPTVGPFTGRLDGEGERLALRNAQGGLEDEVDYQLGFPWPNIGGDEGYSMELVNPSLDNDLGGSWRPSDPGLVESTTLIQRGETWRYFKGTMEASSPVSLWRQRTFNDSAWLTGRTPIGYGEGFIVTTIDMNGNYASVYLRRTFQVDDPALVPGLALEVQYDDGFNAWINGVHVAGGNVSSQEIPYSGLAAENRENLNFQSFSLPPPAGYLVQGTNVLAIQLHNSRLSGSSDAFIDARLLTSSGAGSGPTPGAQNSVFAEVAPPQMRQVDIVPESPVSGQPVLITVKATDPDGVAAVSLSYQIVEPGYYIERGDPEYATDWTTLAMNDSGVNGDAVGGDDLYSVIIPADVQSHRRLVRFRITARDSTGLSITAPFPDDTQPNFAYFVYDGLSGWRGAIQPGSTDANRRRVVDYAPDILSAIPSYFLITKRTETEACTWTSKYEGENYLWTGTLVCHGKIYDHIGFRARGGVWRYSMGKNMWKFNFNRGHRLKAFDDFGREYRTRWDKLNFSAVIQQGDYGHRGEQGLFEATSFKLFNLMGTEAPRTHFVLFHIIDGEEEFEATQYDGDLWGLYLVLEQPDGKFLDEHGLPDGNFYKMEGGTGELNNLGPAGPKDKSDLNSFLSTYAGNPADSWWIANLDLGRYYGYRCVVEGVHHYDIGYGKNYFYYRNPETLVWSVMPWDLDLTWADTMFGDGNEPFKSLVLSHPAFSLAYKNRMREFRDLLYNPEQMGAMIDEFSAMIDDPLGGPSIVDMDRSRWDYNPIMMDSSIIVNPLPPGKAGYGRFYQIATTKDFPGMGTLMKDYVVSRGGWIDSNISADSAIPRRPTVTSSSPAGYPMDALAFEASTFSDPQGNSTFGAMKWRVAEVTPAGQPAFDPARPHLFEITPSWESGEITPFASGIQIPPEAVKVGSTYRARVRMKDNTGRWSSWSLPVEFVVGVPSQPLAQQRYLRVTEIMYHPAEDEDLEFIELENTGPAPLDLEAVSFTEGIEFRFADGAVTSLGPGEHVVVVANLDLFTRRYGGQGIRVAGEYQGSLSNGGERILLVYGGNLAIQDFTFSDLWYPATDGGGFSLVIVDPTGALVLWSQPSGWMESGEPGGSPGVGEGGPVGGLQLPGDGNQDGSLDLSDGLAILLYLFGGGSRGLPCDGGSASPGNLGVVDVNSDAQVNLTDAVYVLNYLFKGGPPPVRGTACIRLEGCPSVCGG